MAAVQGRRGRTRGVTVTASATLVTQSRKPARAIRPPDPIIRGTTLAYMPIDGHEATRRLVHLAFRDAHTALDLTYAHGGFWREPLPPGQIGRASCRERA